MQSSKGSCVVVNVVGAAVSFLSHQYENKLYSIVTMTPEMHSSALRSLTQPCLTAHGI